MFRIKICGVTNVHDARAAAHAGADAIGLNFFPGSRRFVEPLAATEIAAVLPSGIRKVGVFVNHDARQIAEIVQSVGLDLIQVHGDEPASLLADLPQHVLIIRAHRCGRQGLEPLVDYLDACRAVGRTPDAVLIDAEALDSYGGSGQRADWTAIVEQRSSLGDIPLILAGGLTPDNVDTAIATVRPSAVDVASGVESAPGRKDDALVSRFVAAARRAFENK